MNYIDIVLVVPLLWGIFKGFKKGLIIELVSLIALVLGVWGSVHFSDFAAQLLSEHIQEKYLSLTAFMLTFIAIVVLIYFLGKLLEKVINIIQLKFVNKLLGACFGLLKFGLIISVLLFIIERYNKKFDFIPSNFLSSSILYKPMSELPCQIIPAIENSTLVQQAIIKKEDLFDNQ